ncbi:hypothetical protein ZIOFF_030684 [Zingiber officinale]|uniref:Uncharacterized protein n=1 Tax=Zingiber officinale TaxID=94328 RepID=A0A8J5H079_ZINOF|nr:hypothetical protein ZIOFF_030684 [Zingiber officinale]
MPYLNSSDVSDTITQRSNCCTSYSLQLDHEHWEGKIVVVGTARPRTRKAMQDAARRPSEKEVEKPSKDRSTSRLQRVAFRSLSPLPYGTSDASPTPPCIGKGYRACMRRSSEVLEEDKQRERREEEMLSRAARATGGGKAEQGAERQDTTWADLAHYYQVAPHSSNWMQQQKTNLRRSIEPNFGGEGLLDANSLGEESVC